MKFNKQWIYDHNRLMAPVLAIIFSTLLALFSIFTISYLIFLVPVVTFFTFHYTKLYRLKLRLLAGVIVFIVVALISVGILTSVVYASQPTYSTQFLNENGNETGSTILASVTPYSGSSATYTYHFYIVPNGTFDYNSLNLNIAKSGGGITTVNYSQMTIKNFTGNNTEDLTYVLDNPGPGLYSYNLTVSSSNGVLHTPSASGPFSASVFVVYLNLVPFYGFIYIAIYGLVFLAGVFMARSISNSRRYNVPPPPKGGNQKKQ